MVARILVVDDIEANVRVLEAKLTAEYRALAYQAFNIARLRLDEDFDKKTLKKLPKAERKRPRAIVVDIACQSCLRRAGLAQARPAAPPFDESGPLHSARRHDEGAARACA